MRYVGTCVRGIRTPVIKNGDNLEEVVVSSLLRASKAHNFEFNDRDVVGITEAVVAITQGNYVTLKQLTAEIKKKFPGDIGVVFPILSRNRFSLILTAIANACSDVHILLSYPSDEVGNHLMNEEKMFEVGLNPCSDSFEEEKYRALFDKKDVLHEFTGMDYVEYYKSLGHGNIHIHFSNDPRYILEFTKNVLVCDIHTRFRTKKVLQKAGVDSIYSLTDICSTPSKVHGFNPEYGLLGSNKVGEDKLKLFPRDCYLIVNNIQKRLKKETGKNVEVMVYGDGAFKDPVGGIWELADPVVSPGFTDGLLGRPNEIKLKFVSENWNKQGSLDEYVKEAIRQKKGPDYQVEKSLGTTPRQLTDLLGSLCDLTSGSGDKGTPVVLIQGYFDDYTKE
ncbi:MAG TPA: coenzyme F420-0:L-glutamate ligase [Candidatus Dojkabacteria bacterium]|jgi:F420-0:gamma-glutamyl ligase|nr:coenzyme F420-0:L-glutamate ligase [Candidatus Dojkabacteria bacterium]HOV17615.1 coenzyme F420-0:L-glutamate ligase [Candidatus Dojkabacteria bacterium]HQA87603.1 coenzyme F420-0:L-glutamate ligase [Candidatus Dojkabacteria bacterium]